MSSTKINQDLSPQEAKAAKQKATEEKYKLFSTWKAMSEGKMPHNAQLDDMLTKLINNQTIRSREHMVSDDGRRLLQDFRDLLQTLKRALHEKNQDELFQSMVYHSSTQPSRAKLDTLSKTSDKDKDTLKSDGKKASDALYQIGKLMLVNNEFRSLLGEVIDISQDIFTNMTSKLGDSLKNAGDDLQGDQRSKRSGKDLVDSALDRGLSDGRQDTFDHQNHRTLDSHHRGLGNHHALGNNNSLGNNHSLGNTHSLGNNHSLDNTHSLGDQHDHALDDQRRLGPGNQSHILDNNALGSHGALDNKRHGGSFDNTTSNHKSLVSTDTTDPRHVGLLNTGDSVHPNAIPNELSANDSPLHHDQQDFMGHRQRSDGREEMGNKASDRLNEHKKDAHQTVQEHVPKEKRDELLHRLQRVLGQIQQHPDYQRAIETLIRLVKSWSNRLSQKTDDMSDRSDDAVSKREFKSLVEAWAQGQSIDPLLNSLQQVMRDARNDPELHDYYGTVMDYVKRMVREPEYASRDESLEEGRRLMDRGQQVLHGNYDDHLNHLSSQSRHYWRLMAEDPVARDISDRVGAIHRDLWMDSEGNPTFKPHLLNDMKMTLLPALMDEIRYIPIPRIEYSDKQYDVVVENLVISGDSLLPNVFDTKIESFNSFSLKTDEASKPSSQSLLVRMSEIQADMDDVVFWYNKKTGFPKLQDRGVASMAVGRRGITLVLRLRSVANDPTKTFKVDYCKCTVDKLKIKVNDSRHNMLYKTIAPLMMGTIRK
ncbi:hypothetical protein G6F60_006399 [Rhizopus arrhizus]|nr:hypothetical protein G6F60_006399 [Rhizopus arrhizus]